jgi:hypothetical protein
LRSSYAEKHSTLEAIMAQRQASLDTALALAQEAHEAELSRARARETAAVADAQRVQRELEAVTEAGYVQRKRMQDEKCVLSDANRALEVKHEEVTHQLAQCKRQLQTHERTISKLEEQIAAHVASDMKRKFNEARGLSSATTGCDHRGTDNAVHQQTSPKHAPASPRGTGGAGDSRLRSADSVHLQPSPKHTPASPRGTAGESSMRRVESVHARRLAEIQRRRNDLEQHASAVLAPSASAALFPKEHSVSGVQSPPGREPLARRQHSRRATSPATSAATTRRLRSVPGSVRTSPSEDFGRLEASFGEEPRDVDIDSTQSATSRRSSAVGETSRSYSVSAHSRRPSAASARRSSQREEECEPSVEHAPMDVIAAAVDRLTGDEVVALLARQQLGAQHRLLSMTERLQSTVAAFEKRSGPQQLATVEGQVTAAMADVRSVYEGQLEQVRTAALRRETTLNAKWADAVRHAEMQLSEKAQLVGELHDRVKEAEARMAAAEKASASVQGDCRALVEEVQALHKALLTNHGRGDSNASSGLCAACHERIIRDEVQLQFHYRPAAEAVAASGGATAASNDQSAAAVHFSRKPRPRTALNAQESLPDSQAFPQQACMLMVSATRAPRAPRAPSANRR